MVQDQQSFLCTIPYVAPSTTANTTANAEQDQQQELMRASDHGRELLEGMQSHCIYYNAGYWVYSFCYNNGISQFHPLPPGRGGPIFPPIEDKSVSSFVLGRFGNSRSQNRNREELDGGQGQHEHEAGQENLGGKDVQLQTRGQTNFLVQTLGGGTTCDLTGKERRIEVQFHCNPTSHDRINMIKETASCVYLMVIDTPRLCNDVAFLPPKVEKPNLITCEEILDEDEVPAWTARKVAQARREDLVRQEQEDDEKQSKKPIFIGGVELGAQKFVGGSPERTIRPGKIITNRHPMGEVQGDGTQEKYVATLAKSDGKYTTSMSEGEMKKHGLKGGKEAVEKWIRDMQGIAGEEPWKLDVVDTPGGREFRGIFGHEPEEQEEKGVKQPGKGERRVPIGNENEDDGEESGSEEEYRSQG